MIQERIKIQVQGSEDYAHLDTYVLGRYLDDDPNPKKPLVLICPGGAYKMTSNREAEPIALQFTVLGIMQQCCVIPVSQQYIPLPCWKLPNVCSS